MTRQRVTSNVSLTEEERGQVAAISVVLPKDRRRNRLILLISLVLVAVLALIIYLFWATPERSSQERFVSLNGLAREVEVLERDLNLTSNEQPFSYDRVLKQASKVDRAFEELKTHGIDGGEAKVHWDLLKTELGRNELSEELVQKLPRLEMQVKGELSRLNELLLSLSNSLRSTREFSVETVRYADLLIAYTLKIEADMMNLLSEKSSSHAIALANMTNHLNSLNQGLNALKHGSYADGVQSLAGSFYDEILTEAEFVFASMSDKLTELIENAGSLVALKNVMSVIDAERRLINDELRESMLAASLQDHEAAQFMSRSNWLLMGAMGALGLLLVLVAILLQRRVTLLNFEATSEKARNDYHENAILRLVDEVALLAKGDLSAEMTVTHDSTGVIADSINVAVEELRMIVGRVNRIEDRIVEMVIDGDQIFEKVVQYERTQHQEYRKLLKDIENMTAKLNIINKYFDYLNKSDGMLHQLIEIGRIHLPGDQLDKFEHAFNILSGVGVEVFDNASLLNHELVALSQDFEKYSNIIKSVEEYNAELLGLAKALNEAVERFTMPTDDDFFAMLDFDMADLHEVTSRKEKENE